MEETKQIVCQGCPKGCSLQIEKKQDGKTTVEGARCPRGTAYACNTLGLDETQLASNTSESDIRGGRGGGHHGRGGRGYGRGRH